MASARVRPSTCSRLVLRSGVLTVVKIYTKTGDDGSTGLLGPGRVGKDSPRIEAYGTVDELNAVIGDARASGPDAGADGLLATVQDDLFAVGAALADPDPSGRFHNAVGPDRADPGTGDRRPRSGVAPADQLHPPRGLARRGAGPTWPGR